MLLPVAIRRIVFKNCDERQPAASQIKREAEQLQLHFKKLVRKPSVQPLRYYSHRTGQLLDILDLTILVLSVL